MKTESLRKHIAWLGKTDPIFKGNPVLYFGICLPFVIVPSMTLKAGVLLSVLMFIATLIPVAIYASIGSRISKEIKFIMSAIISTSLVSLFFFFTKTLFAEFYLIAGVYAMLFGVNGLTSYIEYKNEGKGVAENVLFAFKACVGYSIVVCFISFVRELLALKTIWGYPVDLLPIKLEGIAFPFFGFIMLGFLSAFFRCVERWNRKRLLIKAERLSEEREEKADAE